ncbi:hypothetical protein I79_004075 [Cricetulus griseus]|uniref:Uncharacterized protein n=1 Tax=Cricetulus griseus TaxID=10029 RepID=G3H1M6_CRIGR|nr:hypothetical protein I79_004075 [Cricetulus griseus]
MSLADIVYFVSETGSHVADGNCELLSLLLPLSKLWDYSYEPHVGFLWCWGSRQGFVNAR